jgi:hypothetical protein
VLVGEENVVAFSDMTGTLRVEVRIRSKSMGKVGYIRTTQLRHSSPRTLRRSTLPSGVMIVTERFMLEFASATSSYHGMSHLACKIVTILQVTDSDRKNAYD